MDTPGIPETSAVAESTTLESTVDGQELDTRCSHVLASARRCLRRGYTNGRCWQHDESRRSVDCKAPQRERSHSGATVVHRPCKKRSLSECAICMENVHRQRCTLDCKHAFHRRCIRQWLLKGSDSCPLCRRNLSTYEMYILGVKKRQEYLIDTEITTILAVIDMLFADLI
jgi:hypothetical protein